MQWLNINSSAIKSIAYEIKTRIVFVEFHSEAIYSYHGVSSEVFAQWCSAPSFGQFFQKHIRNNYAYDCVKPPTTSPSKSKKLPKGES